MLPFENVSANPAQDDVAASVTREVTDIFAGAKGGFLIPAATAATYRGKAIDLPRIGREHDVHFALLGNSRQHDGRLIVSVTLYETAHGNQVWAKRFERAEEAETGSWVVASLIHQHVEQAMMDEEARAAKRDHPGQLDKRDLMFAAYSSDTLQISKAGIEAQIALIEQALALDPNYVWALQANGRRHADLVIYGFSDDTARDVAIAAEAIDRALQLAPNNYITDDIPVVDANVAATLLATGRLREAIAQARLAVPEFTPANGRIAELPWLVLIAAQSASGRAAEARADLNRFLTIPRTWNTIAAVPTVAFLSTNPVLLDGLRDAGMPLR